MGLGFFWIPGISKARMRLGLGSLGGIFPLEFRDSGKNSVNWKNLGKIREKLPGFGENLGKKISRIWRNSGKNPGFGKIWGKSRKKTPGKFQDLEKSGKKLQESSRIWKKSGKNFQVLEKSGKKLQENFRIWKNLEKNPGKSAGFGEIWENPPGKEAGIPEIPGKSFPALNIPVSASRKKTGIKKFQGNSQRMEESEFRE